MAVAAQLAEIITPAAVVARPAEIITPVVITARPVAAMAQPVAVDLQEEELHLAVDLPAVVPVDSQVAVSVVVLLHL